MLLLEASIQQIASGFIYHNLVRETGRKELGVLWITIVYDNGRCEESSADVHCVFMDIIPRVPLTLSCFMLYADAMLFGFASYLGPALEVV